jgi:hypothetical protein
VGRVYGFLNGGGGGVAGGQVQEGKGGPVQNVSGVEGEGGGVLEGMFTHWSLYTFIRHKRVSPRQQFSGL